MPHSMQSVCHHWRVPPRAADNACVLYNTRAVGAALALGSTLDAGTEMIVNIYNGNSSNVLQATSPGASSAALLKELRQENHRGQPKTHRTWSCRPFTDHFAAGTYRFLHNAREQ